MLRDYMLTLDSELGLDKTKIPSNFPLPREEMRS